MAERTKNCIPVSKLLGKNSQKLRDITPPPPQTGSRGFKKTNPDPDLLESYIQSTK
jgi:hypothetical protein